MLYKFDSEFEIQ